MPDSSGALPTLSRAREAKIGELSQHFANDDLSLDELERRIERVYKAGTIDELESITADLRHAPLTPAAEIQPRYAGMRASAPDIRDRARILAIMSETRRTGRWVVPHHLEVLSLMSDTRIDLTQAALPSGVVEINLRAVCAACKVIVPAGVRIINEMHAVLGSARTKGDDPGDLPTSPSMPTIRLTGLALMAEIVVVVRRRERTAYDDTEDG